MIKVDFTTICLPPNRIAVSDDAYFKKDYGPDEGDGPNYKRIVEAMTACGAIQVNPCIFDLNGYTEDAIVERMTKRGFAMDMDEDFCECMCEYDYYEDE